MSHFHYPGGRILGEPDDAHARPEKGDIVTIGRHTGAVVNARPYGYAHEISTIHLPLQPQDPYFSASRRDVVILPKEHHGKRNPYPHMLVLSV